MTDRPFKAVVISTPTVRSNWVEQMFHAAQAQQQLAEKLRADGWVQGTGAAHDCWEKGPS